MVWSSLSTTGQRPGTRDSHSSVLVDHKMVVMGGTNGSKKVNDLHILDLRTKEWSRPICEGNPPSPRESHSATVMGDSILVVFGGSGEGEGNYLNDVHVLDLKTMQWTSPEVKGDLPPARDSHAAVAIDNKLIVYGGDCGDRYYGQVDVLDMDTLTWSKVCELLKQSFVSLVKEMLLCHKKWMPPSFLVDNDKSVFLCAVSSQGVFTWS